VVCGLLFTFTLVAQTGYADFSGKVIAVADGNTLTVLHDGRREKVRLNGIDAPELSQAFGIKAMRRASTLALGKRVMVVPMGTDKRGRTVADVFLPDNRLLNHELVREGLAWWYKRYALGDTVLEQLERDARKAKRGLWTDSDPLPPWKWRQQHRHPSSGDRDLSVSKHPNAK
jgi:micrococcal nuclease